MNEAPGLRERKKTETRVAIQQAVLFLALGRGLDAVTADEIAAAANVSVRTFHNYFGSKEEALVAAWVSEFRVYVEALRDRPADEPISRRAGTRLSARSPRRSRNVPARRRVTSTSSGPASRWHATGPSSSMRPSGW